MAFLGTVHKIEYHDVASCGIYAADFPDEHLCEWTKQAVITLEEAIEAYMVEVTAEFHC
jgi:hypothetical protein